MFVETSSVSGLVSTPSLTDERLNNFQLSFRLSSVTKISLIKQSGDSRLSNRVTILQIEPTKGISKPVYR